VEEQVVFYKNKLEEAEQKTIRLESKNQQLQFQLDQLKRMIFGAKSERFVPATIPGQLSLEIELPAEESLSAIEAIEIEAHERKKKDKKVNHPVRQVFPADLPREEIIIYPEGFDENSIEKPIGEEVTEVLEEIPGKLYVKRYRRLKYASQQTGGVVIGTLPTRPIEKGLFGEQLLAQLMIDKYCDHIPFYRQEQRYKRAGISIAYSTLADTPRQLSPVLVPLYEVLKGQALKGGYLQADETPHPVMDSKVKGKTHQGYLWVYRSVQERLVLFEYRPGRGSIWPKEFLKNYKGFIQTDGYSAYDGFKNHPGITLVGCMAHARRAFESALQNDKVRAEYYLNELQKVYAVERQIKEEQLSAQEITIFRNERSRPVLNALEIWLKENLTQTTPTSPIGKAIAYSLVRWKKLMTYLDHYFLEIDNNLVENAIRPTVLGRKNYMFSGSHEGAQRSAMMYSFLGSCKMNNVNPKEWLADVLLRLPDTKHSELIHLLPCNWVKS
jgi:transposase